MVAELSKWHLAQINIARLRAPLDDPLLAEFVENLDGVNLAAEQAEGFVWRLKDECGNATEFQHFGPEFIINMSVWRDVRSLRRYVASEPHRSIMMKKENWFYLMDKPHLALWWIAAGHVPTLVEADEKLDRLQKTGPIQAVFTFAKNFSPPDE